MNDDNVVQDGKIVCGFPSRGQTKDTNPKDENICKTCTFFKICNQDNWKNCTEHQPTPETKDSNPKDAVGIKKVPTSTIPTQPMFEIGLAMLEGARKYGRHNYRVVGTRASVYYDAINRHIKAWWEGEDIDPDSGLHHLIKAAACCLVHRDSMLMENAVDDRPPQYPHLLDLKTLNERAAALIEQYPDCVESYTQKRQANAKSNS